MWIVPVLLRRMYVVTYLSAKIGQVYGKGLFAFIRDHSPRRVPPPMVILALASNIMGRHRGGAEPPCPRRPHPALLVAMAAVIYAIQYFGSYTMIRQVFRRLGLVLFADVAAAIMARLDPLQILRATFIPRIQLGQEFLMLVAACIGTSLSAYVYTWQSSQEVEEQIASGCRRLWQRQGASAAEMKRTSRDVLVGMILSNVILYFTMARGLTLHPAGETESEAALEPLAAPAATYLFAAGVIGVGFLAVPVMTTGAAYDAGPGMGREGRLHEAPVGTPLLRHPRAGDRARGGHERPGLQPDAGAGLVRDRAGLLGAAAPLHMTILINRRRVMGKRTNGWWTNVPGRATTLVTFLRTAALVVTWFV